ncbi:STAS domain-containing protein [Psychrobacillus sp. FSL K6-2684]|uniref:STAS domain-containing protein n=1 Tax=Psychrobacillus faecigallinarum TaxID=2762235 RepID=A0ABR8REE5_9BACI|nr:MULTISPECIES: STAS domain-containing protein [Psychrobacillus]MBD7946157.1 STAS domain-containing protein [Psychrobacillus faecigallinarum]QEY21924.1 STAS domain-containing protein [Psychrobacillus sp. AK 1817]QGM32385.1 STAS domain-containing protein [Bacillus sp. N3536]
MNKQIATYIHDDIDEILEKWKEKMEDEKDDRFFQIMSEQVIDHTAREFGELMISSLTEDHETYTGKLNDFSVQIVRYGWSISFVLKALNNFTEVIYENMEIAGHLNESNYKSYRTILNNWLTPVTHTIVEAYAKVWEKTVNLQKIALQELSASLIPVFEKISVMPLVGTIDTERAKLIMENLLQGVVKHRAEVVLLDITGVPVVDTMVAHHIIQAADAVRLVGAKCFLVGIRPEIAQTIVTLGINLNDFTTTSTLQRGVEQALALTNRAIVEVNS